MSAGGWRSGLGFAERMSATMKLQSAYKKASPSLSGAELQAKATEVEQSLLNRASSIDEYKSLCQSTCAGLEATSPPRAAAPTPPPESTESMQTIGPFRAQYHASGLFSTVYRSTSASTGAAIAIKLTTPGRMGAPHDSEREARLLALAGGRSCTVPLLEARWIAGGHFCLVFPFLPFDLGGLLGRGALAPAQIRAHLLALFSALAHLHALGIVHRDVKPSNLLLAGADGPAMLADFGISWRAGDASSEPELAKITDVGTTCYRAPELLFGFRAYGPKLDMWAAGCVLAECLKGGRTLFDAGDLGSELALISSIFRTLGTPGDQEWPEASRFPDWGKMAFKKYDPKPWSEIMPAADAEARDLVSRLVTYESADRLTAAEVLEHPFFKGVTLSDTRP